MEPFLIISTTSLSLAATPNSPGRIACAYLHSCASTAIFQQHLARRELQGCCVRLWAIAVCPPWQDSFDNVCWGHVDVHAFGVVVAEILTGRKAVSSARDDIGLANHFRSAVKQGLLSEIPTSWSCQTGQMMYQANSRKKEVAAELNHLRNTKELNKRDDEHCEAGDNQTISEWTIPSHDT